MGRSFDRGGVRFDSAGLVPVVVQAADDGRVLMLGYADAEALDATLATGELHLHSRSRGRLWRKGETSGNVLRVVELSLDCDCDALLAAVEPAGPTCHRGTRSCFDPAGAPTDPAGAPADPAAAPAHPAATPTDPSAAPVGRRGQGFAWLEDLWATIERRRDTPPAGSYTASLLEAGVDAVGRKVVEEATELLIAAKDDAAARAFEAGAPALLAARQALADEGADLIYHALVLLAERALPPSAVIETLRARAE